METMKQAAKALIRDGQGNILVLYRSETHPYLAHDIDLPGGEIESDETPEIGLEREIMEETGIAITLASEDKVHSWRSFFGATHMLYETTVPTGVVVEISWEHEAYVWMTEEEFAHSPAIDEFMHKVQERLLSAGELHPVTA
jgi:8-oxo-dGTP pyrophosphatase MutT (NUDIX family)